MNPLRLNLRDALLSITLLLALVSLTHPEVCPAKQAIQATHRSFTAFADLAEFKCSYGLVSRINPLVTLKRIVRSML